jgi:hypothetical protein
MPNKKISKRSLAQFSFWKPILIRLSIAVNIAVLLFIIVFSIGYRTGNSYQTKEMSVLYNNQCNYYFANTANLPSGNSYQDTRVINGKKFIGTVVKLDQNQINSGCFDFPTLVSRSLFYQLQTMNTNYPLNILVYIGPNGHLLPNTPREESVFIQPSRSTN